MRGARLRRVVVPLIAAGLAVGLASAAAGAATPLKPCDPQRPQVRSLCGHVTVPLDRSGALPGVVRLRVRLLPAHAGEASETILALAGGPGQAAAPLLPVFGAVLGDALRSRDLVVLDQRGTGHSGRLRCPELDAAGQLVSAAATQAAVAACAARLGPARAHYATADSVADIEAVRAALGVERFVLYGTSYGTKVALDYAAAHPDRVSRLVLDSVAPREGDDPFLRLPIGSIPRVLRTLCAGGGCPFTADPAADLAALAGRLAQAPLRGRTFDGRGRPRPASLDLAELLAMTIEADSDPLRRAALPAAVRSALRGDEAPILRLAHTPFPAFDAEEFSAALFVATNCADGSPPWSAGTPLAARPAAVDAALAAIPAAQLAPFGAGAVRTVGNAELCLRWPEAPIVQPLPALPDLPALILSGDEDVRTPRAQALALAARLPRATVVTVPHAGHSVLTSDFGGCSASAVARFLAGREPRPCGRRRPRAFPIEAPAPVRLAALPVAGERVPPRVGRTLSAVRLTVADSIEQLLLAALPEVLFEPAGDFSFAAGGLRGGSIRVGPRALVLRRYAYVPGVRVSGRLVEGEGGRDELLRLRVGGRAAARGHVRIGELWIVGRLGGARIRERSHGIFDESASAAAAAARATGVDPLASLPALRDLLPARR